MSTPLIQICRRCGQCCAKGGPALHAQDVDCFGTDGLSMEHLLTLRPGELVHDQPTGKILQLDGELVKIRDAETGSACCFYAPADKSCAIYPRRPAECRALECAAPEPLKEMYEKDRLSRRDLLPEGHPLLELLEAHDEKCSPYRLSELADKVLASGDEAAVSEIGEMLAYDQEIRSQVTRRAGLPEGADLFLFGRPLTPVLTGFGLRVEQSGSSLRLSKNPLTRKA